MLGSEPEKTLAARHQRCAKATKVQKPLKWPSIPTPWFIRSPPRRMDVFILVRSVQKISHCWAIGTCSILSGADADFLLLTTVASFEH